MYKYKNGKLRHPVVVVSDVDANSQVKIAMVSHKFPENVPKNPVNDYADFGTERGTGFISVGPPKTVNIDHLKPAKNVPYTVKPDKLQLLMEHISMCGLALP